MRFRARLALVAAVSIILSGVVAPTVATAAPIAAADPVAAAADDTESVPVYRFWSPTFQGHFYTIDPAEREKVNRLWSRDWTDEGERYRAFATQVAGTVPLYRFWSDQYKGHFFTASESEKDHVIATWPTTWSFEGVAYYVYPQGSSEPNTAPVYRFWGPTVLHHFYTASNSERDRVISLWPNTWSYEQERFRVPSAGLVIDPTPSLPADKDCGDFTNWRDAQAFFGQYYAYYGDFARLDGDGDLIVCEWLPGAP